MVVRTESGFFELVTIIINELKESGKISDVEAEKLTSWKFIIKPNSDMGIMVLATTWPELNKIHIKRKLALNGKESKVRNAILHEFAHVIATKTTPKQSSHGRNWIRCARRLGVDVRKYLNLKNEKQHLVNTVKLNERKMSLRAKRPRSIADVLESKKGVISRVFHWHNRQIDTVIFRAKRRK